MRLDDVLDACDVKDGATLSFHHHLRNGDGVLNAVMDAVAARGLRDITIAASSLFPVHAPLVAHCRSGVVSGIHTAYISGPVATAISKGLLDHPITMTTHGGRARAIESGQLGIDVAFVATPTLDVEGNISGVGGPTACGVMGYPMVDAAHARQVVALTDHRIDHASAQVAIPAQQVDHVVDLPSIGESSGMVSGITRVTDDPLGLQIAATAAGVIEASGQLADGFSFQTGAGGVSLAVSRFLAERMTALGVRGSFASGGITGAIVDMFEAGLFEEILDVQCFDHRAVDSFIRHANHHAMSASRYANPDNPDVLVNQLDCMILGAAEIDLDFNVNVTSGSDGLLLGGSGGHADTAAGSKLAIVTTALTAREHAKVVDRVTTITTPGDSIDVLVTEAGVAVNPRRPDLADRLVRGGIDVKDIRRLRALAVERSVSTPSPRFSDQVAAIVENRDGSVIDTVRVVR